MNALDFLASVVGSLAWPVTVVVLVLILKRPISQLLPLLRKAKYKEFELDFAERVEEVREFALAELPQRALGPGEVPLRPPVPMPEQNLRSMVLDAWLQLEAAAVGAARQLSGRPFADGRASSQAIRFLETSEEVDRHAVGLLRELRSLRNEAVHVPDFAISDVAAIDYALTCAELTDYFRSLAAGAQQAHRAERPELQ